MDFKQGVCFPLGDNREQKVTFKTFYWVCRFHCGFVHGCSIKPGFHKMQKDVDNKHLALEKFLTQDAI